METFPRTASLARHTGFPFGPFLNVQLPVAGDRNTCNLVYTDSFFCQVTVAGDKGGAGNSYSNQQPTFERPNGNFPGPATSATNPATGDNPYFTRPTSSASGFPSAPGILRNNFRGPHYRDFDFTLGMEFVLRTMPALGENAKIAFHANFYNLYEESAKAYAEREARAQAGSSAGASLLYASATWTGAGIWAHRVR
ncbi:MAG: hypothetical protein DMG82_19140 [Acidobacteria bacterium]|nr:MAG: hypothetical protein DMG82_19140 [Acidobacteriota bacterium]